MNETVTLLMFLVLLAGNNASEPTGLQPGVPGHTHCVGFCAALPGNRIYPPGLVFPCPGDGDDDCTVTVTEQYVCDHIALGDYPVVENPTCDVNRDGAVTPDELECVRKTASGETPCRPREP